LVRVDVDAGVVEVADGLLEPGADLGGEFVAFGHGET